MSDATYFQSQRDWIDSTLFEQIYPFKRRTFFAWIAEGKLTPYRPSPRKTLVRRGDVDRLIEASRAENPIDQIVTEVMSGIGAGE